MIKKPTFPSVNDTAATELLIHLLLGRTHEVVENIYADLLDPIRITGDDEVMELMKFGWSIEAKIIRDKDLEDASNDTALMVSYYIDKSKLADYYINFLPEISASLDEVLKSQRLNIQEVA